VDEGIKLRQPSAFLSARTLAMVAAVSAVLTSLLMALGF
jgi:hypothetical protein